jgi:tetratricopeptide (TPR) repeat protein
VAEAASDADDDEIVVVTHEDPAAAAADGAAVEEEEEAIAVANQLKKEANALFQKGSFESALSLYQRAIDALRICKSASAKRKANETEVALRNYRTQALMQLKEYRKAAEEATAVLGLSRNNSQALLRRGLSYEFAEQYGAAFNDFETLIYIDPTNSGRIASNAIDRLRRFLNPDEMRKLRSEREVVKPTNKPAQPAASLIAPSSSARITALHSFPTAAKKRMVPGEEDVRAALHSKGAPAPASSVPMQPLTQADSEPLKTEGNKAYGEARYAEAVQKFTEAMEACPTDHVLWANRAASYLELNEAEKALADAVESARLEPRYMKAHYRQGLAHLRLGRGAEAVAALERAVAIDPTVVRLAISLAEAKELAAKQAAAARGNAAAVAAPASPSAATAAASRRKVVIEEVDSDEDVAPVAPKPAVATSHGDCAHPYLHGDRSRPATSRPRLGPPLPHLCRDWVHPCRICARTGLTVPSPGPGLGSPLLHFPRDWALSRHISRHISIGTVPARLMASLASC